MNPALLQSKNRPRCRRSVELERDLLEAIQLGTSVAHACRALGITRGAPTGWARSDVSFRERYRAAVEHGRTLNSELDRLEFLAKHCAGESRLRAMMPRRAA